MEVILVCFLLTLNKLCSQCKWNFSRECFAVYTLLFTYFLLVFDKTYENMHSFNYQTVKDSKPIQNTWFFMMSTGFEKYAY